MESLGFRRRTVMAASAAVCVGAMEGDCRLEDMKGHAQRQVDPAVAAARRPPASGAVKMRVRYCECDPMNVAHHAAYAPWLEIARTELLRESGVTYAQLEHAGIFLVITKMEVRYRRPIFYDDVVEIRTRVVGGSRVKIEHEYEVAVVERR